MNRLLLLLAATALVAGCTGPGPTTGDDVADVITGDLTEAQARSLLQQADAASPQKFGMKGTATRDGVEIIRLDGAADNASGEAYMTVFMDPSALQGASDEGAGFGMDDEALASLFANGFSFYMSAAGNVYLVNDTAFVFPTEGAGGSSFAPSAEDNPFDELLTNPTGILADDLSDNTTITSYKTTTFRGKPAVEIQGTTRDEEGVTVNATFVIFQSPARVAKVEAFIPADPEDPKDPFSNALFSMELFYDDEVTVIAPETVKRAAGLLYVSDASAFGGSSGAVTWTFRSSAGIALEDVEAQVKDPTAMGEGGVDSLSKAPTLWSMSLAAGTMAQDGVTLTFTDVDEDGKVSAGDTLRIEGPEDGIPPQVVLFDTQTGLYVVPGFGLVAVLAALAAVAVASRKRVP